MKAEDTISDPAFRCLATERRRRVLRYLRNHESGVASLDDLVDHVLERETRSPARTKESVAIDLYHVQLPVLADRGVLEFDARTKRIRYEGDGKPAATRCSESARDARRTSQSSLRD